MAGERVRWEGREEWGRDGRRSEAGVEAVEVAYREDGKSEVRERSQVKERGGRGGKSEAGVAAVEVAYWEAGKSEVSVRWQVKE